MKAPNETLECLLLARIYRPELLISMSGQPPEADLRADYGRFAPDSGRSPEGAKTVSYDPERKLEGADQSPFSCSPISLS
jgi:hypothetical protein